MKFKHSLRNYLLAPIILIVNPIMFVINYLLKYLSDKVDKAFDSLPRFDLDYSKEYKEIHGEVFDRFYK